MTFSSDLCCYFEDRFSSRSQLIRVATEKWTAENLPCPACSASLDPYPNNMKVFDFHCESCNEKFQLKSSNHGFSKYVLDGEYKTQLASIRRGEYPSILLLSYQECDVDDVTAVHRSCIIPDYVIPRKPLSRKARRAGWQGCNFALFQMPDLAKISLVINRRLSPASLVMDKWKSIQSLLKTDVSRRGWLADVLKCVEQQFQTFTLQDLYASSEEELQKKHPDNRNVRPKMRQQLQYLRDLGFVEFVKPGIYRFRKTQPLHIQERAG